MNGRRVGEEAAGPATGAFLTPAAAARLGGLEIVARALVEGFLKGLHYSPAKGSSSEFSEHRPYTQGDPVTDIDWRTYARTDRYYLKEYDDETNVRATLVLDASGSMAHPERELTKFGYARCLVAALGHLLLLQRDAVGLALVADGIRRHVPPQATERHLRGILDLLERTQPEGATRLGRTLDAVAATSRRRGLVIIVSDLLDDAPEILAGIGHLRHRGAEVLVFHLVDPDEETFPFRAWTVFRDPEDPRLSLRLDARQAAEVYRENFDRHLATLASGCRAAGADYAMFRTDTPFEVALAKFLERRRAGS